MKDDTISGQAAVYGKDHVADPNKMVEDLISRQAAINLVKDVCEAILSGCGSHYDGEDEVYDDLLEADAILKCNKEIMTALKHMPSAQQWVSCKKRLPNRDEYIKNNGLFIVSDGNRSYSEWYDIYNKRRFGEPTMSGFRVDYAVTHWMPFPAP